MLNLIFKHILNFNATFWVVVIFGIKNEWTVGETPEFVFGLILLCIPILFSILSLGLCRFLSSDEIVTCCEVEDSNASYLSMYLGYFFVGLSIGNWQQLILIYLIIYVFTYVSQAQYFNPILLLFGYRFYKIKTITGTNLHIITDKRIRSACEANGLRLKRINDSTYIDQGGKHELSAGKNKK